MLLLFLFILPGILAPFHEIKAAPCQDIDDDGVIEASCEYAPDTYYYTGTLTIDAGVTVTLGSQSSPAYVAIFADDIIVNGTISANAMGNAGGAGSCPGSSGTTGGGGCLTGYGGKGSSGAAGGSAAYGFAELPTTVGSGGGDDTDTGGQQGGRGGGAIWLGTYSATGTLSFGASGAITANGEAGTSIQAGGGSGGSIYLDVGVLDIGEGTITANGGNGAGSGTTGGGGGGGGQIALRYSSTSGSFAQVRQAKGGNRGTTTNLVAQPGGAGTVWTSDLTVPEKILTVDNDNQLDPAFTEFDMVNPVNDFNLLEGARLMIDDQLEIDDTFTYSSTTGGSRPELWVRSGFITLPDEEMTLANINIHHAGAIGGVRYLTFDSGLYSIEASATYFGGQGKGLGSLTLSGTGTTTFSATGTGTAYYGDFEAKGSTTVTHVTNATTHLHSINISATGTLDIASGATVNVSGRGYSASSGPGQGADGGCGGGGGHGGRGGQAFGCGSTPAGGSEYGSVTGPTTIGSAGGNGFNGCGGTCGGAGGGAIRLAGGTITIGGSVNANGAQDSGGGAGGSIWIDAGTFAGSGTVTANGGGGDSDTGGGGGRIALTYATDSSSITPTAFGGTSSSGSNEDGGAGTVFIDDTDDAFANGELNVINNNPNLGTTTTQISGSSETYDGVTISSGARYVVPSTSTLALAAGGTLTGGGTNQPTLTVNGGGTFDAGNATFTVDDIDVALNGVMSTVTDLTVSNASFTQSGTGTFSSTVSTLTLTSATFTDASNDDGLNLTSISMSSSTYNNNTSNPGLNITDFTIPSGSTFNDNSSAYYSMGSSLDDVVVDGTFSRGSLNRLFLDTLTVNSGGTVTHAFNGSTQAFVLDVSATTSITVNGGGSINVSGRGYSSSNGPGQGGDGGCGGGGSHGGKGGQAFGCSSTPAGGTEYGSVTQPTTIGSAGGNGFNGCGATCGGEGGGAIRIEAPTVTIDGSVNANGVPDSGGGAGGSVWIDVGTFAGSGTVTADGAGGDSDTGGGGGRIAIYYATDSSSITPTAFGGASTSGTNEDGGAGTVFIDDTDDAFANGELRVINNNPNLGSATTQVSGSSETYDDITITNGTEYVIPSTSALALASGGTLTGGGTVKPTMTVQAGGTFDPNAATFTFNEIGVTNSGTVATVTDLTVSGQSFTLSGAGTFGATVTSLTLSSATFTNGSTNPGLNLAGISMTASTYNNNSSNTGLNLTDFTVPAGSTFNDNSSAYYTMGSGLDDLVVAGTYVRGSANALFLGTLTVNSGGFVSHASNTTSHLYSLVIDATSTVSVASGGSIDARGRGFTASTGTGQGGDGGCGGGAGHGGTGGNVNGCTGNPLGGGSYGSVTQPTTIGSGGGNGFNGCGATCGGTGGGAVRITAAGLTVDGTVTVIGLGGGSGGGSGGSVWIDVGTFAGAGTVSADGGTAASGGGGGGGRVALYYGTDSSSITPTAKGGARSGGSHQSGSAGTVFIDDTDDALANGTLRIDNNNQSEDTTTTQSAGSSETYDVIDIRNSAEYVVPSGATLTLAAGGTFTGSAANKGTLTVNVGGTFDGGAATLSASGVNITNNGSFATTTSFTYGGGTYANNGTFTAGLTSLTVASGANWRQIASAQLFSGSDLTIQSGGTFTQEHTNAIEVDTVTVESGGTLTHCDNTTAKTCQVNFDTTTFTVQSGGTINVDAKGFDSTTGSGQGGDAAAGGGAGYGGDGGDGIVSSVNQNNNGTAYGSATGPVDLGSGGGDDTNAGGQQGGAGGGVIRIVVSGTLTMGGTISADGGNFTANEGGGGSGGSIWLTVDTITAAGTISADGGLGGGNATTGGGCGGGGRIAIDSQTYSQSATTTAAAGSGCTGVRTATAGSVYLNDLPSAAPTVNGITHSPASPFVTDNVTISASATYASGLDRIELYLDGTTSAHLRHTCDFTAATDGSCSIGVGLLSRGTHTTTVKAYGDDLSEATDAESFYVDGSTTAGSTGLSRLKVGVLATFTLTYTLSGTSTQDLVVTFPGDFTVESAFTSGSSCLSNFNFTSTTLTADTTDCTGTVTATGATVTNPSTPGAYVISWIDDEGETAVAIVDDDQVNVTAAVNASITFDLDTSQTDSETSAPYTVPLGTVSTADGRVSGATDGVNFIWTDISTNASAGAVISVRSANGASGLVSVSVPAHGIPSTTATQANGTANYGICVVSMSETLGTLAASSPFNGSCTADSETNSVGGLTTLFQDILHTSGAPLSGGRAQIAVAAAVSASTPAHNDYTDTLTFIATGTY